MSCGEARDRIFDEYHRRIAAGYERDTARAKAAADADLSIDAVAGVASIVAPDLRLTAEDAIDMAIALKLRRASTPPQR